MILTLDTTSIAKPSVREPVDGTPPPPDPDRVRAAEIPTVAEEVFAEETFVDARYWSPVADQ